MLRKGSRSTRLWESPHVPSERYERRPCLCVFVARLDRRLFYYSSKTDSWGRSLKVTAPRRNHAAGCCFSTPLKQRQLLLMNMPLSQCHEWPTSGGGRCNLRGVLKITPRKWAQSVSYHMAADNSTLFSLNEGGREGRREGGGGREGARGWWGGREQGRERGKERGREVGSDDARQTESVSGGSEW